MTEHSKRTDPNQFPLTAYTTNRKPPRRETASPQLAKDSSWAEPPSLEALRAKLLPVIPAEYFEHRPRVFGCTEGDHALLQALDRPVRDLFPMGACKFFANQQV
jgi:hypothetical protein